MNNNNYIVAAVLFFGSLVGCATPYRSIIPIDPAYQPQLTSTDIYLEESPEHPIVFQYYTSDTFNSMGGGLLWALIDSGVNSSRKKNSESLGGSIKEALSDISVPNEIKQRLDGRISHVAWLKANGIDGKKTEEITAIKNNGRVAFTRIAVNPIMDPVFSELSVKLVLEIYEPSETSKKEKREPIYRFTWNKVLESINENKNPIENVEAWSAGNGEKIRKAIFKGMDEVSNKILAALEDPTSIKP
jgi:hypothetical protein